MTQQNENDQKILEYFKVHELFCKSLLDAYAVVNSSGKVLKCNQLLSVLLGTNSKQIMKENNLDVLLSFLVDGKRISTATIINENKSTTRIDEVGGATHNIKNLNLILGYYPFLDQGEALGAFLLIRDVTAETHLQGKYKDKATQSITDKLTGLFNRNYFDQFLPSAIKSIEEDQKSERTLCIMLADIDHFKKINDTYGHLAGDYVIEKVSDMMKKNCRKSDVMCRYGGEEFLGILQSSTLEGTQLAADKLRSSIQGEVFLFEGQKIIVTISIGVAQLIPGKENAEKLVGRADEALYFSKENGRNRVSVHYGDKGIT